MQASSLESDLADVTREILSLEEGGKPLLEDRTNLKGTLFKLKIKIERLLEEESASSLPTPQPSIKLPKISVPSFDGNIMNWASFWEQFDAAIHSQRQLKDTEMLIYLKEALKDGPAKGVIMGLAQTADNYEEAVHCLKERYDRPRLIYQAHVHSILESTSLKEGNGKELHHLHDIINQHVRAISAMDQNKFDSFITALLDLKLDQTTMFEWQRYSEETKSVPPYPELLKFLDLRA